MTPSRHYNEGDGTCFTDKKSDDPLPLSGEIHNQRSMKSIFKSFLDIFQVAS
jgi:hypothetical protein